jgi:hypothetical protein
VTAPAVPFVADAAVGDVVSREDRIWLVALLGWIAAGSSYLEAHGVDLEGAGRSPDETELAEELAGGALGEDVDRADLLRRLPEDYYDTEGVEELRGRLAEAADEREVYREILEEVAGLAIDVGGRGEQAGG